MSHPEQAQHLPSREIQEKLLMEKVDALLEQANSLPKEQRDPLVRQEISRLKSEIVFPEPSILDTLPLSNGQTAHLVRLDLTTALLHYDELYELEQLISTQWNPEVVYGEDLRTTITSRSGKIYNRASQWSYSRAILVDGRMISFITANEEVFKDSPQADWTEQKSLFMTNGSTAPEFRKAGFFKATWQSILSQAIQNNLSSVTWETSAAPENSRLVETYKKWANTVSDPYIKKPEFPPFYRFSGKPEEILKKM